MVQVLTDLELVISKSYISSDGGWFMDGKHSINFPLYITLLTYYVRAFIYIRIFYFYILQKTEFKLLYELIYEL